MSDPLACCSSELSSETTNLVRVDTLNAGSALRLPSASIEPFTTHRSNSIYVMKLGESTYFNNPRNKQTNKHKDKEISLQQRNCASTSWLQDIFTSHNYKGYFLFYLCVVLDLIRPTLTILRLLLLLIIKFNYVFIEMGHAVV
jgi:hypothetical protein